MTGSRLRRLPRLALLVGLVASPALAVQPDEILPDAGLEARARAISSQLRCLVCQNQSIDESDAPLARDLRLLVRERLRAGDTDGEASDYIVRRYGEFVLLRPVLAVHTALLWLTPGLLLAAGLGGLVLARRRRSPPPALTGDEQARLDDLLARNREGGASPTL